MIFKKRKIPEPRVLWKYEDSEMRGSREETQREVLFLQFRQEIWTNRGGAEGARNESIKRQWFFSLYPPWSKKARTVHPLRIQMGDTNAEGAIWVWFCTLARVERKLRHLYPIAVGTFSKKKVHRGAFSSLQTGVSFMFLHHEGTEEEIRRGQHWTT